MTDPDKLAKQMQEAADLIFRNTHRNDTTPIIVSDPDKLTINFPEGSNTIPIGPGYPLQHGEVDPETIKAMAKGIKDAIDDRVIEDIKSMKQ
jgi:hypothetical protein